MVPKDKRLTGVAEVAEVAPFEDDETCSGVVFKTKRKADAANLVPSDSDGHAPSYREYPPSASCPCDVVVHEGRRERSSEIDQWDSSANFVESSGIQALKNPNPLKDVEALAVLVVAVLV